MVYKHVATDALAGFLCDGTRLTAISLSAVQNLEVILDMNVNRSETLSQEVMPVSFVFSMAIATRNRVWILVRSRQTSISQSLHRDHRQRTRPILEIVSRRQIFTMINVNTYLDGQTIGE